MPILTEEEQRSHRLFPQGYRSGREAILHARKKRRLRILSLIIALIFIGAVAAAMLFQKVLRGSAQLQDGMELRISPGKGRAIELSWDAARLASGYRVEIYDEAMTQVFRKFCHKPRCTLKPADLAAIPMDQPVHVSILARDMLYFLEKPEGQEGWTGADYTCLLQEPEIADCRSEIDVDGQSVDLQWMGWGLDTYTLYLKDSSGNREYVREIVPEEEDAGDLARKSFDVRIPYGQRGDFRIPKDQGEYILEMEVIRDLDSVVYQGKTLEVISLRAADLRSQQILVDYDRLQDNRYRLSWNDVGSFAYSVEILRPGADGFERLVFVDGSEDLLFETKEHLRAGKEYTFRVMSASEDDVIPDRFEEPAGKATDPNAGLLTVFTAESPLYASIWPMKALDVYAAPDRAQKLGSVSAGQCLCVLEEDRDSQMFRVRTGDAEGYIDSNYCMINLPDYIGEYCQYDIPNSYASIYMVNDYYIPYVTGRVIPGYEDVLLDDDTFLVPLLYPVAAKLADAAEEALADGYRIEINDSFRPHCATRYIYDETNRILDLRLPELAFWGYRTTFEKFLQGNRLVADPPKGAIPEGVEEAAVAQQIEAQAGEAGPGMAEDAGLESLPVAAEASEAVRYTYFWEMTGGSYRLGSFLAAAASRHNLGVAMDMTLVRTDQPDHPLDMQTEMHNLSWRSAMSRNNGNADILKKYMTGAGFGMISSEWWHFQDNDATASLQPPIMENGVTVEGWKRDDKGWRYRDRKGNYITGRLEEIGGKSYAFDAEGYADY